MIIFNDKIQWTIITWQDIMLKEWQDNLERGWSL